MRRLLPLFRQAIVLTRSGGRTADVVTDPSTRAVSSPMREYAGRPGFRTYYEMTAQEATEEERVLDRLADETIRCGSALTAARIVFGEQPAGRTPATGTAGRGAQSMRNDPYAADDPGRRRTRDIQNGMEAEYRELSSRMRIDSPCPSAP
ncbi:hypothetical protein [Streptosporangium sp. OZ121]|uniref:hypothetical protein n=1 Tax=Streptosporangium sp. OZ121 TaxID=3444183 RepID=UPI003F795412